MLEPLLERFRRGDRLGEQPRLPDARGPLDHHQRATDAEAVERTLEALELAVPFEQQFVVAASRQGGVTVVHGPPSPRRPDLRGRP